MIWRKLSSNRYCGKTKKKSQRGLCNAFNILFSALAEIVIALKKYDKDVLFLDIAQRKKLSLDDKL